MALMLSMGHGATLPDHGACEHQGCLLSTVCVAQVNALRHRRHCIVKSRALENLYVEPRQTEGGASPTPYLPYVGRNVRSATPAAPRATRAAPPSPVFNSCR